MTNITLEKEKNFVFLTSSQFWTIKSNLSFRNKRRLIMQKEDLYVLKQVVLFTLIAVVLGFVYG